MRGNATFTAADLSAGSAGVAALAKKFGGARAIWDAGVCSQTQSHHMCMGPCDAWQPRDPATQRPLLEPVWVYLLTNTDEPSPKVTPRPPCFVARPVPVLLCWSWGDCRAVRLLTQSYLIKS